MDYSFSPCTRNEITATDIREYSQDCPDAEYAFGHFEHVGHRKAEAFNAVFIPSLERGAVTWGADAQWTDADSIEEVLQRYVDDNMSE